MFGQGGKINWSRDNVSKIKNEAEIEKKVLTVTIYTHNSLETERIILNHIGGARTLFQTRLVMHRAKRQPKFCTLRFEIKNSICAGVALLC